MRPRVRFSVACMGAYVRVFVSACVRVSVARQHACVCVYVSVRHAYMRACLACMHVYMQGEATCQSADFFIFGH